VVNQGPKQSDNPMSRTRDSAIQAVLWFRGVVGSTPGERWKTVGFSPAKPNLVALDGGHYVAWEPNWASASVG